MKAETFCVITVGKRFLRCVDPPVVCRNIEQAAPFETLPELKLAWQSLKAMKLKKPLKCWKVKITEFDADG